MRHTKTQRSSIAVVLFVLLITSAPVGRAQAQNPESGRLLTQPEVNTLPAKGKRWALIIGVDNYDRDISMLRGSVNDAKALKGVLVSHAGFPSSQVILMTTEASDLDLRPTRGNILDALERLSRQIPEGGLLLFSFSGHGISIDSDAFLIPADGKVYQNAELMRERSIDVLRVKRAIQFTKAKQVLMFLDACRDEPLRRKGDGANPMTEAYEGISGFDNRNKGIEAFATLFATSKGDRAYEFFDKQHQQYRGFFSHAIEEALRGEAANENGEITLGSLIKYLERTVSERVYIEKNQRQVPYPITEGYRNSELVLAIARDVNASLDNKKPSELGSPGGPTDNEREAFLNIRNSTVVNDIRAVLEEFPTSRHAPDVRKRLERLVWESVKASHDKARLQTYLDEFGDKAQFASLARIEIRKLASLASSPVSSSASNPAGAALLANQALTEIINGNYETARRLAEEALQVNKGSAVALAVRGWATQELNLGGGFLESNELARKDLEESVKLEPNNALSHARLISVYSRSHQTDFSDAAAKKVLSLVVSPTAPVDYYSRGVAQYATKHFAGALADLTRAIEAVPRFAHAYFYRAAVHRQLRQYDLAIADLTKALESAPRSAYLYHHRGATYAYKEDSRAAFQDYAKAIALDPRFADPYNGRGNYYLDRKDYLTAIRDYTKAIELDPQNILWYCNRALAYLAQKDFKKALRDVEKAVNIDPRSADAYIGRGNYYYNRNDYGAAIRAYTTAIDFDPQWFNAYNNRGKAYYEQQDYQSAISDYSRAIELDPQNSIGYNNRGEAYLDQENCQAANRDYAKAIELDPQNPVGYNGLGNVYSTQKDYTGAIREYTKAIEVDPGYSQGYVARATVYLIQEDYVKAIIDYTKAIELDPQLSRAFAGRGYVYALQNDYLRAIRDSTKAIELEPQSAYAYAARGDIYVAQNDYRRAIRDYTKAIELSPQFAIAYVARANAHIENEDYQMAVKDGTRATELDPRSDIAYNVRGLSHLRVNNYPAAIRDFTKAIELDPESSISGTNTCDPRPRLYAVARFAAGSLYHRNRGVTYYNMGDYQAAIRDLTKAIELDPKSALAYYGRADAYERIGRFDLARADRQMYAKLK